MQGTQLADFSKALQSSVHARESGKAGKAKAAKAQPAGRRSGPRKPEGHSG